MQTTRALIWSSLGAGVMAVCVLVTAAGQQPPAGSQSKTAEQVYKNIQVLQGTPTYLFLPEMRLFEAALGVDCNYCHLEEDRSKDDLEAKQTARSIDRHAKMGGIREMPNETA